MEAACVCYHFATQLLNMWQDTAVSDDQKRTPNTPGIGGKLPTYL
jgi:hypothetical protein